MTVNSKRRSLLFVPAIQSHFYKSAFKSEADALIFDLEDSIADTHKNAARHVLCDHYPKNPPHSQELIIRINDPQTPYYQEDIRLVNELQPHAVLLPKVETPDEIRALHNALNTSAIDDQNQKINIMVLIESIAGFYNAKDILRSPHALTAVAFGAEDIVAEIGIARGNISNNAILLSMLTEILLVSRMHNLQCIGPITRMYSQEYLHELEQECQLLKAMNLTGKLAIHPSQISTINRIFNITSEQIKEAQEMISMLEKTQKTEGTTVIVHKHQMKDKPSYRKALTFLEYAKEHGFL